MSLDGDIRQFFSFATLKRLDRLADAMVDFTFRADDLYLSVFAEALDRVEMEPQPEYDPDLFRYARVFERFVATTLPGISPADAARNAAALYWLAGYSGNALILGRTLARIETSPERTLCGALTAVLSRSVFVSPAEPVDDPIATSLRSYIQDGDEQVIHTLLAQVEEITNEQLRVGDAREYVAGRLLGAVIRKLANVSLWASVLPTATAPREAWQRYARIQLDIGTAMVDLWPSQRAAIRNGLLDGRSSLVLKMPTSAGKTKLTELAFVNDLFTDDRRCLYLAPTRALVTEIEASLAPVLTRMGIPVASLYGHSDANQLDVNLTQRARVLIATPEKINAVHRLSGGSLADFGTVVLDEGHHLTSQNRGVSYELQLASLLADARIRREVGMAAPRTLFVSAVLPNADEIADWIAGGRDRLAEAAWRPTSVQVAVLTWTDQGARLDYRPLPTEPDQTRFFVPRLFTQDSWEESPRGGRGRPRHLVFPQPNDKGSMAAAVALLYSKHGPVIVYAQQPRWANSAARKALDYLDAKYPRGHPHLIKDENRGALDELADFVAARIGPDSLLARSVRNGIALHHGGIPQGVRLVVEEAFRSGILRLLIATSTISQGVNFPAKTIVVHSLPRGDAPVRDFWNLVGRAGRAMKETEGEVVILDTGNKRLTGLHRFLDPENMEPAESQILRLVQAILNAYPVVSEETIQALLEREAAQPEYKREDWVSVIQAIDGHLLQVMAEDLSGLEDDDISELRYEAMVQSLFAMREAEEREAERPDLVVALMDLFDARRAYVQRAVPDAPTRARFARSGLPLIDARQLDDQLQTLGESLRPDAPLDHNSLGTVIEAVAYAPQLGDIDVDRTTDLAWAWIDTGRYGAVFEVDQRREAEFKAVDDAVDYVESVLSYRLSWIVSGLLRLNERSEDEVVEEQDLPLWMDLLPQYLQYGVNRPELVWIMSLGVQDRLFAEWLLRRIHDYRGRESSSFIDAVDGLLWDRERLLAEVDQTWPPYFRRLLEEVLERYAQLRTQLAE